MSTTNNLTPHQEIVPACSCCDRAHSQPVVNSHVLSRHDVERETLEDTVPGFHMPTLERQRTD